MQKQGGDDPHYRSVSRVRSLHTTGAFVQQPVGTRTRARPQPLWQRGSPAPSQSTLTTEYTGTCGISAEMLTHELVP